MPLSVRNYQEWRRLAEQVPGRPESADQDQDRWRDGESPVGSLWALPAPIALPGGGEARMGVMPALGEYTGWPLRAAGMTDEEIAALRRDGVVA